MGRSRILQLPKSTPRRRIVPRNRAFPRRVRTWGPAVCSLLLLVATTSHAFADDGRIPVAPRVTGGIVDPQFSAFDRMLARFVRDRQVPGASLAVALDGRLVLSQGYGLADVEHRTPVEPDSLFRVASVSKAITAVAVLQLIERNRLRLVDRVYPLVAPDRQPEDGAGFDSRLRDVTIQQLLQHRGGWDRELSFDPLFHTPAIATAPGVSARAESSDIVRFMFSRRLDFDPGDRCAYSNFGYFLLGRVIEKITGETYEDYVRRNVLQPIGITRMRIGATAPTGRAEGEVEYYVRARSEGARRSTESARGPAPLPVGGWRVETMDANGGWIASAADLVRFAAAVDSPHSPLLRRETRALMLSRPAGRAGYDAEGKPRPVYYGCGWEVRPGGSGDAADHWHQGALDGTSALLFCRGDGLAWAVLFNMRTGADAPAEGGRRASLSEEIAPLLERAADECLAGSLSGAASRRTRLAAD